MNGLSMDLRCLFIFGVTQIHFLEVIMKRKVLCIALALLMCMMVSVPAFADAEKEVPPDRSAITISYSLKHVSGSTYKMRAKFINPENENIIANLILYDASHNYITSVSGSSSEIVFIFSKQVNLSSGTYYLELVYIADTSESTLEKVYHI